MRLNNKRGKAIGSKERAREPSWGIQVMVKTLDKILNVKGVLGGF